VSSLAIAGIVFTCIFAGAVLGMVLQTVLPEHHLSPDSKDVVKVGMGLIATMAALVLGLLTGSAKSAFDAQDSEVKQSAANLILLDRMLAHYGPETKGARDLLRSTVAERLAVTWPETGAPPVAGEVSGSTPAAERILDEIRVLTPQNDSQRWFQSQALQISVNVMQTRWLLFEQGGNSIQVPLLVVLVFWLIALFASFGLFAPRNGTVIAVLALAALSVAGALFLILEMNQPFQGLIKISGAPMRYTLAHLGQ
jgi:hypothetical protein